MGGRTPLHLASKAGDPAVVLALLEAGACALLPSEDGKLPLHVAKNAGTARTILDSVAKADGEQKTRLNEWLSASYAFPQTGSNCSRLQTVPETRPS